MTWAAGEGRPGEGASGFLQWRGRRGREIGEHIGPDGADSDQRNTDIQQGGNHQCHDDRPGDGVSRLPDLFSERGDPPVTSVGDEHQRGSL